MSAAAIISIVFILALLAAGSLILYFMYLEPNSQEEETNTPNTSNPNPPPPTNDNDNGETSEPPIIESGWGGSCEEGDCKNGYVCVGGRCDPVKKQEQPGPVSLVESIKGGDCSKGEGIDYKYIPSKERLKTYKGCAGVFIMNDDKGVQRIQCGDVNDTDECGNWVRGNYTVKVVEQISEAPCEEGISYGISDEGGQILTMNGCKARFQRSDGLTTRCGSISKGIDTCFFD